jgi:hypothetical protein
VAHFLERGDQEFEVDGIVFYQQEGKLLLTRGKESCLFCWGRYHFRLGACGYQGTLLSVDRRRYFGFREHGELLVWRTRFLWRCQARLDCLLKSAGSKPVH